MKQQTNQTVAGAETRRDFIRKSTLAAAVAASGASLFKTPVYGQDKAPAAGRVIGANDRISVAYIGVGGQGMTHVRLQKEKAQDNNIVQVGVSDLSKHCTEEAKKLMGDQCKGYEDYRKMLEDKSIDAVCVSTVDHWHAPCCIDAMEAGKHVYCEKPMTRYLDEAFAVYDSVKKTGKVFQVGAQGCSDAKYHEAAKIIKAGKLGTLVLGTASYMRNNPKGEWNYAIHPWCTAEDINWNMWLGKVNKKGPFSADQYRRWRKYYPFCAGLLGDLMPHRLHPWLLATGAPEFPVRVASLGTKAVHTDKLTEGTPERDVNENVQLLAEFPSGLTLMVTASSVNEQGVADSIRGHKATLTFGGNRVELKPERPFSEELDPETVGNITPGEAIEVHEKNWFDCIRSGAVPNGSIDLAIRVQTIVSLAEMSERLNMVCLFDEKTRKITNGDGKEIKPISYGTLPLS